MYSLYYIYNLAKVSPSLSYSSISVGIFWSANGNVSEKFPPHNIFKIQTAIVFYSIYLIYFFMFVQAL